MGPSHLFLTLPREVRLAGKFIIMFLEELWTNDLRTVWTGFHSTMTTLFCYKAWITESLWKSRVAIYFTICAYSRHIRRKIANNYNLPFSNRSLNGKDVVYQLHLRVENFLILPTTKATAPKQQLAELSSSPFNFYFTPDPLVGPTCNSHPTKALRHRKVGLYFCKM